MTLTTPPAVRPNSAFAPVNDLELLDGVEGDVDRGALATGLFTKETDIVIASIKADIVKNAALAGKIDLIAVGALRYRNAWREGQKVLKLSS